MNAIAMAPSSTIVATTRTGLNICPGYRTSSYVEEPQSGSASNEGRQVEQVPGQLTVVSCLWKPLVGRKAVDEDGGCRRISA
jgi:hypothetical protein